MNENEKEFSTLDLEDILKEFGGNEAPPAPVQEPAEPGAAEQEPEAPSGEPEEEVPPTEEVPEELPEELAQEAEEASEVSEAQEAEPESVPEEEPAQAADEPEEIAGQETEPVYIPPEPIRFRPRSRLRELKRQLIAGPEKRYYELTEIGVGKLQAAILFCLVVIGVSVAAGSMYALDMIPENRMRLMVFGQIFAMLLGALMGYNQILDGISDLFHGKFSLNTMLFITLIACVADGIFCLQELRVPICAAFTLEVTMALWSTYHRRSTEMGQMDTLRKAIRLDSVVKVADYWNGRPGILRGEGQVEDFMEHYQEPSAPEKRQNAYAFIALVLSVIVAVAAGWLHGVSMALRIFSASLLVAVPASFFVSATRPMSVLERRFHSLGTVLCSWKGVKELSTRAAFPLADHDIFPNGSVKLNGVKFYGDRDPEVIISYATSLICVNGGGLMPIFRQLLESRSGPKYPVKDFQTYENGGISGEVCGETVLMGSIQFLQEMGVEIPAGTMVNQAVYVAINGKFSGLFAITYTRMKYSASGLATVCAYRGLTPVITADDFMLTGPFLKEKFGVNTRRMAFPTREEKAELLRKSNLEEASVLALTTHDGLAPAAYAVTGARALKTACNLGLTIHIIGGILGLLIMAALAVLGAVELLTPLNVLLYQLVWMVPGLLVTEWTRAI